MANRHQRQDKRLGSQGDSPASKFRYRLLSGCRCVRLLYRNTCAYICMYTCFTLMYTWMCAGLVYGMCVCAYQGVYVCAGRRISGVRNRKLTQPFGCSPNWLCAVDRMLTEHIAQTGTLFLSVSSSGFVKIFPLRNSLLYSFFQAWKKKNLSGALWQVTKLVVFLVFGYRKGNGEAGDRPALMRLFSASYRA